MKKIAFLSLAVFLVHPILFGQNLQKKFKRELKRELKSFMSEDFKIEFPPLNQFGAGTLYKNKATIAAFEDDYWGVIDKTPPVVFEDWKNMNGIARVASTCSSEKISKEVKSEYAANIIMPKIYQILKVKADVNATKLVNSTLSFGSFYLRAIRKQPFENLLKTLESSSHSRIVTLFNQGNLVVTSADVIVENISYEIEVNNTLSASIDAQLSSETLKNLAGNNELGFKMSKSGVNKYKIEIDKPVIVATLSQIQSGPGVLGKSQNKSDYLLNYLNVYNKPVSRKKVG